LLLRVISKRWWTCTLTQIMASGSLIFVDFRKATDLTDTCEGCQKALSPFFAQALLVNQAILIFCAHKPNAPSVAGSDLNVSRYWETV